VLEVAGVAADWGVSGSYFEACNCDAICPCRWQGGRKVSTGSTYGICQFALSWFITRGHAGPLDLAGMAVVLAGFYRDDEAGKPWRVGLYVDERASDGQFDALSAIFLGQAGGTPFRNFAKAIGGIPGVRRAAIELDHRPGRWLMRAAHFVEVRASAPVATEQSISCGIPGHDQQGKELTCEVMRVVDDPLEWNVRGRCGFTSAFAYVSDSR